MEPVDVRDLVDRPGTSRQLNKAEEIEGLATELAEVRERVRLDLLLESVVEGILVSGPLTGSVAYRCARCLTDAFQPFTVSVTELYARHPGEEEYQIHDGVLDLEPMVRDAVILSLPFSPLCRPDCAGLCERCGGNRNHDECTCPPPSDHRWAALDLLNLD
ncbi:MAG TPA: YceD family protein [Actinomycetota bacterium]|jgi:uncharacterized protein